MNWFKRTWMKIKGTPETPRNTLQLKNSSSEDDLSLNLGISVNVEVDDNMNVKVYVGSVAVTSDNERGRIFLEQADDRTLGLTIATMFTAAAQYARQEAGGRNFNKIEVPLSALPTADKTRLN